MRHQLDSLSSILECLSLSWPILLVGPSARSSKSTLIDILSSLSGHPCQRFELNSSIDTNELLGSYEQFNFQQYAKHHLGLFKEDYLRNHCRDLVHPLIVSDEQITLDYLNQCKSIFPADQIDQLIAKSGEDQHFVWIESILIRSMRQGDWLILENVNTCSLSVLDRLNSLLEPKGDLIVNEGGGQGMRITPHRDFRLILTMDPKQGNGEISRAMRNRCCEIYIDDQQQFNRHDLQELIQTLNIEQHREDFIQMHQILSEKGQFTIHSHFSSRERESSQTMESVQSFVLVSTFAFDHLIRSCLLFNEFSRSSSTPFQLAIKSAYRTLNSRLNNEIDALVDGYVMSTQSESSLAVYPTRINDLCLQGEWILSDKFNSPLWLCSSSVDQRRFQLLFYRFLENVSSASMEYDLFAYKHPEDQNLIEIVRGRNPKENHLLTRILIEQHVLSQQLTVNVKTKFIDEELFFQHRQGQFWSFMKDYFLQALPS